MLSRKGLSRMSSASLLVCRNCRDCSPRISPARLRNCSRSVSSLFSRSARSAARCSALRSRRAAISAAVEARSAASSFSVSVRCAARVRRSFSALSRAASAACFSAARRVAPLDEPCRPEGRGERDECEEQKKSSGIHIFKVWCGFIAGRARRAARPAGNPSVRGAGSAAPTGFRP